MTLAEKLESANYRASGFDYLRIGLATAVLFWHAFMVSYGLDFATRVAATPVRAPIAMILPMFFGLSGFLVAQSLERNTSLLRFFRLRVLRIFPALCVEVVLSAFILGPLLTTIPLADYFSHPEFHHYLLNMVGDIHYFLPGVFEHNPEGRYVNGQLWTVPYELLCYAALAILGVVGIVRHRWLFLAAACAFCAYEIARFYYAPRWDDGGLLGAVHGHRLVQTFVAGVAAYQFRDRLPANFWLFASCLAASLYLLGAPRPVHPLGDYVAPFPIAYVVAYLGSLNPERNWLIKFGDYSYGAYLYGSPIGQVVASFGAWAHHWWINFGLAVPVTFAIAALSWRFVERPVLARRNNASIIDSVDRAIARARARLTARSARRSADASLP